MAFSKQEVIHMMSDEHRWNTAAYLQKNPHEVTLLELIAHWERHHSAIHPIAFNVVAEDPSQGLLFERRD